MRNLHFEQHSDISKPPELTKRSNVPSLVCAFSASATTGGTIYAFGIYGDALKKSLNISQLQLNAISATFFIAGLFSWIPGLVVDRKGMRFSMCLGGSSGAISTMMYWAVSRKFIDLSHYAVMALSFLAVAICLSCGLVVGSIFKLTILCGGPANRGSAVGIAKGFVGLGAGVYATIFQAFRTPDESALDFLPVIAFFFIVCTALPAWLLLPTKHEADLLLIETTQLHFRVLYISLLILGVVIVVSSLAEVLDFSKYTGFHTSLKRDWGRIVLILIIWLGPIWSLLILPRKEDILPIIIHEDDDGMPSDTESVEEEEDTEENVLISYQNDPPRTDAEIGEHEHLNLPEMLRTPSAWLMLWTTTILVGSGTYKTNNMGEMVESLGFSDNVTPATLAIFSVSQAAARILTGVFSEAALKWKVRSFCIDSGVPRPFFLVIASFVAFFSHLMLAGATSVVSFVAACTISGIAFGMAWPLMVLIVGDIFGTEHHGANYMFYDGFTKAVGTSLLSEYVAGYVYEAHVDKEDDIDSLSCYGKDCFWATHMTVAGLALTCVLASFALQFTSRRAYNKQHIHL